MNKLSIEERAKVIGCLIEGCSLRSTVRMTGTAKKTVSRILVEVGEACAAYHDKIMQNLPCKVLQVDEIWSFTYCKQANIPPELQDVGLISLCNRWLTPFEKQCNLMKKKLSKAMSEPSEKPNPSASVSSQPIKFIFEKSGCYRTIHADGAWGRNDAFGNVHLTFYNEKPPIPASGIIELDAKTGQWSMDIKKLQGSTDARLVRELEVDVTLSLPAAVAVRETLNSFINMVIANLEAQQKSQPPEPKR